MSPTRYLTAAEVAVRAEVTADAIRKLHRAGRMPKGRRIGNQLVWPEPVITRWLPTRARRGRPPGPVRGVR